MKNNRRNFLKAAAVAGATNLIPRRSSSAADKSSALAAKLDKVWSAPALKTEFFKNPAPIASVELLRNGKHYLVRVRSTDGAEGLAGAHDSVMATTYPIFLKRVAPYFIGKDARNLEELIHGVYLKDSNYKWQGLPFWVSVAAIAIDKKDMLGKIANKKIGELLDGGVRKDTAISAGAINGDSLTNDSTEHLARRGDRLPEK